MQFYSRVEKSFLHVDRTLILNQQIHGRQLIGFFWCYASIDYANKNYRLIKRFYEFGFLYLVTVNFV